MPRIVPSGSRSDAFRSFRTALSQQNDGQTAVLLVDSEAPVLCGVSGWEHVRSIDNWTKPEQATDKQLHLMVQCMESWFLSDKSCLQAFYGQELNTDVLPGSS